MDSKLENEILMNKCKKLLQLAKQNKVGKLACYTQQNSIVPFNYILEPFVIKKGELQRIKKLGYLWQKLTHLASKDYNFICRSFAKIQQDPLIGPMLKIYKQVFNQNSKYSKQIEKPFIELFRSDFFITEDAKDNIKLIQYNNVSVSMAAMSERYFNAQRFFWKQQKNILANCSLDTYAKGITKCFNQYQLEGIFLAVTQSTETNFYDQDLLFQSIQKYVNIEIKKISMEQLDETTHLDKEGNLYFKQKKVAIVYYRAGYSTKQKIDWNGVKKSNQSNAVNIPSVNAFLINTKKVQAQLSKKQNMLKYISEAEAQILLTSVIDTWDLDELCKQEIVKMIQREGQQEFILKPNQEGGKNNYFGKDAYNKIKQMPVKELPHYILTRKIYPRRQKSTFIKASQWDNPQPIISEIESEVSVYGCVCSIYSICKCQAIQNCCGGYLVRSKPKQINEGGIISGTGAFCALEIQSNNCSLFLNQENENK